VSVEPSAGKSSVYIVRKKSLKRYKGSGGLSYSGKLTELSRIYLAGLELAIETMVDI